MFNERKEINSGEFALTVAQNVSLEIQEELLNKLSEVSLLGDKNGTHVFHLIHFSANDTIEEFSERPGRCCWTNFLTTDKETVEALTGGLVEFGGYRALYAIAIGIDEQKDLHDLDFVGMHKNTLPGTEYELLDAIGSQHIARVLIELKDRTYQLRKV